MKSILVQPIKIPELIDLRFCPISLSNSWYKKRLINSKKITVTFSLESGHQRVICRELEIFDIKECCAADNIIYVERFLKSMLWIYGGHTVYIDAPDDVFNALKSDYQANGKRSFDVAFMERIYEHPFRMIRCTTSDMPKTHNFSHDVGRHLQGYRIGFDAGGSDRKVSAVVDGNSIYSEEVIWFPKLNSDPNYHRQGIMDSICRALSHLPKVDAIGVSTAGVCINNRLMASSLFIQVPLETFDCEVKNIFLDIAHGLGDIPIEVVNDGEVTALAGSMSMQKNKVLGIAMGTSQASGYVDDHGHITGWLNELAFVPVDYHPDQPKDPWSGDIGCGVNYFSQEAAIRLAGLSGLELDASQSPAEKLAFIQSKLSLNDPRAIRIFKTMGIYLGFGLAYYKDFFDFEHVMILGRVVSGRGGELIVEKAKEILNAYFPEFAHNTTIHLPDEKNRRVGQSIAAASLVNLKK